MAGEKVASVSDAAAESEGADSRQRSTIAFPYQDLGDALDITQAIHNHVGTGDCSDDQLAPWTNQSAKSSGYRMQISAAKMFGLIESVSAGAYRLTELGRKAVDPTRARAARAEAFLKVPLYSAVYEKYKGGVIPPAAALERDMVGLGVAAKMKDRARRTFEHSAEKAGFYEQGKNRLVLPGVAPGDAIPAREPEKPGGTGGPGGRDGDGLHPFIQGLLKTLPEPDSKWDLAQRVKWLQTAANIFDLIYEGDGGIEVTPATAKRSPRPE